MYLARYIYLKGLGELVTASEWKRAAIVWAFTETVGRGKMPTNGHLSVSQFANLEISGLTKRDTVAKYRRAWAKAIEDGYAATRLCTGSEAAHGREPGPGRGPYRA